MFFREPRFLSGCALQQCRGVTAFFPPCEATHSMELPSNLFGWLPSRPSPVSRKVGVLLSQPDGRWGNPTSENGSESKKMLPHFLIIIVNHATSGTSSLLNRLNRVRVATIGAQPTTRRYINNSLTEPVLYRPNFFYTKVTKQTFQHVDADRSQVFPVPFRSRRPLSGWTWPT